jgi:hypothetical protein
MAQTFVYNTNELSPQGYLKPANTVSAVSPDNITHLQLRYSDFSSSYVIQGSVVSGENSTFEFSIADNLASEVFKLYYSTDGTTYNVDKTFGGTSGKKLFGATDLSGLVTLTTAQNISGTKTLTGNANIVVGSGSDITVQAGGDITLADAPTVSTDATNKEYVDGLEYIAWVSQTSTNPPTSQIVKNTTGRTWTWSRLAAGNYRLTPSGSNPFSDKTKFTIEFPNWLADGLGTIASYVDIDYQTMTTGGTVDITVMQNQIMVSGTGGNIDGRTVLSSFASGADNLLSNWLLKIRLYS